MLQDLDLKVFSTSYNSARRQFREAALVLGARLESFAIDEKGVDGEDLTIDFALIGANNPKSLVIVSSGLHGVEGFFGSAVQLAWMRATAGKIATQIDREGGILLIHAINPYGFSWLRRTNEDNIDLNRNFLQSNQIYAGAPTHYSLLNNFLNPHSPPPPLDPFFLIALWQSFRFGLPTLRQAIAAGQYDFPDGLFFGGHSVAQSTQIMQTVLPQWVEPANQILHLDFHTGLGKWATYKLFPKVSTHSSSYTSVFEQLGLSDVSNNKSYECQGSIGRWFAQKFAQKNYIYFTTEFGTYPESKVLENLRAENRIHFYGKKGSFKYDQVKAQLLETFCPKDMRWRRQVLVKGLNLVSKAYRLLQATI